MLASIAHCETLASRDVQKFTSLGDSRSAEMRQANQKGVNILDVRTPEEYVYVGHAPSAIKIPWSLRSGKWDDGKKDFVLVENPSFVNQVKERFKTDDMILVTCRSGELSIKACETLRHEGFWNAYSVMDGF